MPIMRDYLERARSIEELFPRQPTALRRAGLRLLALMSAGETRTWESFPQVKAADQGFSMLTTEDIVKQAEREGYLRYDLGAGWDFSDVPIADIEMVANEINESAEGVV